MSTSKRSRAAGSAGAPAPVAVPANGLERVPVAAVLALLTLVAAALRLVALDQVPPGLNQDEALSAWNAWTLLHAGRALSGEVWPLFQCRNIGDHPTMLYFWVLMPFQALGGLNVWTTRLPVALAGVLTVPLVAWIGSRLFHARVGLVAAGIVAVAPCMVFLGRFGVGAGITPLQALLPVAALLLAGFPIADSEARRVRPVWALAAGLLAGSATYGFHSMRVYMPLLLAGLLLVSPARLRAFARSAQGRLALLLLAAGFAITFGPIAWESAVDPTMMKRWEMTRLWAPTDPLATRVWMVAERWLQHFGPGFLFVHGDPFPTFAPYRQGEFGWYVLPGLVAGIVLAIAGARRSASVRTLIVLAVLYPAGDLVSRYDGPHLLRSALGLPALVLLAAWGTAELVRLVRQNARVAGSALAVLLLTAGIAQEARQLGGWFTVYPRSWQMQVDDQVALFQASRWLRPQLGQVDAVFCTTTGMNQPFAILLVGLEYDARRWFADVKERREDAFDRYLRVGKMRFIYGPEAQRDLVALARDGKRHDVVFLVRPHEFGLTTPVERLYAPDGREALWICRQKM